MGHGARVEAAAREVVRRRQAERERQLPRPPRPRRRAATRRRSSGKASPAIAGRSPTAISTARSSSSRTSSSRSASGRAIASRIYMPMIPELAIAMLACARIGAVHSVVFGGFSAESLRDRINDAQAQAAHHRRRRLPPRQIVPLKQIADEALRRHARRSSTSSWSSAIGSGAIPGRTITEGRDHWYHQLMQDAPLRLSRPSRWTPRTCSTSSTPPARPGSPRGSSTRPAATSPARTRPRSWSST